MKRYGILALALVLCATLFTGCRRGNGNMETLSPTNHATTEMPTMPATMPATHPATEPVTHPATEPVTMAPTERETTHATESATNATEQGTTGATEGTHGRSGVNRPAAR